VGGHRRDWRPGLDPELKASAAHGVDLLPGQFLGYGTSSLAIFALVVDVLVLGRLPLATAVSETRVASVVTALSVYILCTLVLPVTTAVANRIEDIVTPRNFLLLLGLSNVGTYPVLAALLWAWLQISAL